jgi:hypothetical protein
MTSRAYNSLVDDGAATTQSTPYTLHEKSDRQIYIPPSISSIPSTLSEMLVNKVHFHFLDRPPTALHDVSAGEAQKNRTGSVQSYLKPSIQLESDVFNTDPTRLKTSQQAAFTVNSLIHSGYLRNILEYVEEATKSSKDGISVHFYRASVFPMKEKMEKIPSFP